MTRDDRLGLNPVRPFALIDHFDLRHMLDAKSPIQEQLFMHHAPHALSNAESAKEVYSQLLNESRMRSNEREYQMDMYFPEEGYDQDDDDFPMVFSHDFQDMNKSESIDYEFCDCCSPGEIAFEFLKAKRKSKPFHGYNPKRHAKTGGLNAKGRAKFKRETGANLKRPVTKKPSKLKPGSKAAKRRKSFCARMGGSKGPTSKDGKLTPKGAALKRWNC